MTPNEQADLIQVILNHLEIQLSTGSSCACCDTKYLKVELKYADEVFASDMIYLSSLKE